MSKKFSINQASRAVFMLTGSAYASMIMGFLSNAIIARSVGPDAFGRYSYIVWIVSILVTIANSGISTTALRFISESIGRGSSSDAADIYTVLMRWQIIISLTIAAGAGLASPWLVPSGWNLPLLFFIGVVLVAALSKAFALFSLAISDGNGEFWIDAVSGAAISLFALLGVIILYLISAPLKFFMVLFVLTNIAYFIIVRLLISSRNIHASGAAIGSDLKRRIKSHLAWTIILSVAGTFGNRSAETYLLGRSIDTASVGFFAIAGSLSKAGIDVLVVGVNSVLMPMMAHGYGLGGARRVHDIFIYSSRLLSLLGMLAAGIGYFLAKPVIYIIYGPDFSPAVPVLGYIVIVSGATLSQSAYGAFLSTTDNQKIRAALSTLSVLLGCGFASLLVPRYGVYGAVVSYAISALLIFASVNLMFAVFLRIATPWKYTLKLYFCFLISAGLANYIGMFFSPGLSNFVSLLLYIIVYIFSVLYFRLFGKFEIYAIESFSQKYPNAIFEVILRLLRWISRT